MCIFILLFVVLLWHNNLIYHFVLCYNCIYDIASMMVFSLHWVFKLITDLINVFSLKLFLYFISVIQISVNIRC